MGELRAQERRLLPPAGQLTLSGSQHVLFYDYVEDILQRRAPHREAHLEHGRRWKSRGALAYGGALGEPPTGALFVFSLEDPSEIEAFVRADPYVEAGLVTAWRVQPWSVVI